MADEAPPPGWQPIKPIIGTDDVGVGKVEMVSGMEGKPCMACKSWEKNEHRLIQHFAAHGLTMRPDGTFETPIAKDFPGRKSLILDPKKMGFCRLEVRPTEDLATCERFVPVSRMYDMQSRIR